MEFGRLQGAQHDISIYEMVSRQLVKEVIMSILLLLFFLAERTNALDHGSSLFVR